jgi:hypothetical protein
MDCVDKIDGMDDRDRTNPCHIGNTDIQHGGARQTGATRNGGRAAEREGLYHPLFVPLSGLLFLASESHRPAMRVLMVLFIV